MTTLTDTLRDERKRRKLPASKLAEAAGFGRTHLHALETGQVDPRLTTFQEWARTLGLEVVLVPQPLVSTVTALLRDSTTTPTKQFTARERQVVEQIVHGLSNREIAEALTLSERTVEAHLSNIFHKLNVANRREIIERWQEAEPPKEAPESQYRFEASEND